MGTFQRVTLAVLSSLLIMGCNTLDLTVNFKDIQGLTPGAPVILDHTPIGRVKAVLALENGIYPTAIEIDADFKALLTEHSTFTLVAEYPAKDSTTAPRTVVMVAKSAAGGTPLRSGTVVSGTDPPAMPEISNLFKQFAAGFESLKERIGKIPESPEFKEFEHSIDALAQRMKDSGKEARERIKNDILPKLEQEFEAMKKRLGEQWEGGANPQQELEPLEKKLNNLKEI